MEKILRLMPQHDPVRIPACAGITKEKPRITRFFFGYFLTYGRSAMKRARLIACANFR